MIKVARKSCHLWRMGYSNEQILCQAMKSREHNEKGIGRNSGGFL